jgi:hypothetical protein
MGLNRIARKQSTYWKILEDTGKLVFTSIADTGRF